MLIYNVTSLIEFLIEKEWLIWMKEKNLPNKLATKKFKTAKVLNEQDQGGVSYAIQYHCKNQQLLKEYLINDAQILRKDEMEKFGDRIVLFRTELQLIEEQS